MKRSGGSRSFRSLGSRMRSFGRSLMRHYVPAEEMPPLDMFAPGWQSAAETPLMWPEAPASNTPAAADEGEYFDAPEENIAPTASRPRPAPARPTPAAPPSAQPPVQRKPAASDKGVQVNPILYELLAKNDAREAKRKRIREEKTAAEIQRQADPDALPIRRRGRMGVDYIETSSLSQGEEMPPRPAKPAATEPPAPANEVADIKPVQRQPQADVDDGAEIFEDWNVDDDDVGGDDDNGGTPPPIDPPPSPLPAPGIAQRLPDENVSYEADNVGNFDVESEADYPQNFADVSVPPSAAEPRRPQPIIQRDFQPDAPEAVDDAYEAAVDETDYLESEVSALETFADAGYETAAPETYSQPSPSQPIQRDYQPAAPEVPDQAAFQQPEFFDAPVSDDAYAEDSDTRPMPVQRAPILQPPSYDDTSDETSYDSLSDWVDAHSDPAVPTRVQRDYQPTQSVNFDGVDDSGAGDVEDGDTRPMAVQREAQPLPSPYDESLDFEISDDGDNSYAPASSRDLTAPPASNPVQRDFQPSTPEASYAESFAGEDDPFEAEADEGASYDDSSDPQTGDMPQQSVDSFTWSGDNNPPPANNVQRQTPDEVENFADDTGGYSQAAPEYDETDDGDYSDFDAPEQQDETVYGAYSQPETGIQPADSPINTVQRQPEIVYDDDFAVENDNDYQADVSEYTAPDYASSDEIADDEFTLPEQGGYTEYNLPPADNVRDFVPPINTVQRQSQAADESFAAEESGEFFSDVEEYVPPVYGAEFEADSSETGSYNQPQTDFQADNAPRQAIQRQPEAAYDEAYAADDSSEFYGEAQAYDAPVYSDAFASETSDYNPPEMGAQPNYTPDAALPRQTVQRQPEAIYDEPYTDDGSEFDVNDYAAPVADYEAEPDSREFSSPPADFHTDNAPDNPPTNTLQRQPDMPEMVDEAPLYGDGGVGEYVEDTGDYTYHHREENRYGDAAAPDNAPDFDPPTNTVQRQPEASYDESYAADAGEYVDDDDDSSLYDSNYQPEYTEFIPAARNIDTPSTADPVQRSEQSGAFEPTNTRPPPFYGDDVYETDISALLGGQPDPRPVQRRAELPDAAPESYFEANAADNAVTDSASVDLYQAMLQTGMVAPDANAAPDFNFDSHTEVAPTTIQRAADDQSASPPIDLFQAMMETGMVQADRDDNFYAADEAEPMSPATRMDLLSLLDTPPPAPRANGHQQSIVENVPSPVYQPPPTPMVQRALSNEEIEQPEQSEQPEKEVDVNVDQLARDVYNALRNRLRIERERRDHNR